MATNGYGVTMAGVNDQAGAGSTSLASPLWMGMWTRMQAAAPKVNKVYTLGFANPALYTVGLNATEDPTAFFDVGGTTDSGPTADGYYASLPRVAGVDPSGWDYVSGLGAPNVTTLGVDLTGNTKFTAKRNPKVPPAVDCNQPGEPAC